MNEGVYCGVVLGTVILGVAVLLPAATFSPTSAGTFSVFELRAEWHDSLVARANR